MSPDLLRRVEEVFGLVIELPRDDRQAFLDEQRLDPLVRAEVESLLAHASSDEGILDAPPVAAPFGQTFGGAAPFENLSVSSEIGSYRILRFLGAGGMGVVYLAEQNRPRRTVALKLVRGGVVSPTLVRRFEREAEILGRLQHPGIAQIYEAGIAAVHGHDQPFLAMELVEGPPITDFVATRHLSIDATLELFALICDAVHHAHQRGIIHRDLKPSNILVDPRGQPKVLDFGVARIARDDADHTTLRTHDGQLVGTLAYMSPEQITGNPDEIDVRSDVYALGVVLYQLLTGRLPHDLTSRSMPEAARTILDDPPTKLSSINKDLRGEVDVIVAKAIEKDVDRRYQSASELRDDIRRFLDGKPILARQDSALYVLRKSLDRYRGLTRVAVASVVLLAALASVAVFQAHRVDELRDDLQVTLDETRQRAEVLRQVNYFTRIGFAQAALQAGDVGRARTLLAECASDMRNFEWHYLNTRADQSIRTRVVNPRGINLTQFSPTLAATFRYGTTLELWDLATFDRIPFDTSDQVWPAFAMSNFGEAFAIAEHEQAQIINPRSGDPYWSTPLATSELRIDVSADGRCVILGHRTVTCYRQDEPGNSVTFNLMRPASAVRISPDGLWAAAGFHDGSLVIMDLTSTTGNLRGSAYPKHRSGVRCLAFSPDSSEVAVGTIDGSLVVWPVGNTAPDRPRLMVPLHENKISAIAWRADGKRIATGSTDNRIRVIEADSGYLVTTRIGHSHTVLSLQFFGEEEVVSASLDGTLRAWSIAPSLEETPLAFGSSIYGLALSPDGRTAYIAGTMSSIVAVDIDTFSVKESWKHDSRFIRHMIMMEGQNTALMASSEGNVLSFDTKSKAVVSTPSQSGLINEVAWSPTLRRAFAAGVDGVTWHKFDGTALGPAQSLIADGEVFSLATTSDGGVLAMGYADGRVCIHNLITDTRRLLPVSIEGQVWSLMFTPDDANLIVTGEDATVLAYNLHTGHQRRFIGHLGPVYACVLSPDGSRLVTGSFDNTVRVWALDHASELISLRGNTSSVHGLKFSADGTRILAIADDGRMFVWHAPGEPSLSP
ncbi:MAG: protein kinase [Phycisphaeraceae bacterium]|nr:protein kinase [Phycisphaeraceae bacterium]MCW5763427.1 protein kinase [Phycisphaeraceae bacterium]